MDNLQEKYRIEVLIDFDNYFRKPIFDYTVQEFEFELKIIIDQVISITSLFKKTAIFLNLYSGWYENSNLSRKASGTLQKLANIELFPLILKGKYLINGEIKLSTSLYNIPELVWTNTYREKKGVPRIRINRELLNKNCDENKHICPAHILTNFTKNKNRLCSVKNCTTKQNEIFFMREQKMVDTMIACDFITFSEDESINNLILVSDDNDHLPALVLGSTKITNKKKVVLGIRNKKNEEYFNNILNKFNIETIVIQ